MNNPEAHLKARKRVAAKIGVYIHGAAFVVGNILLYLINMSATPENRWFLWPLVGWGTGLFFHALVVFAFLDGAAIKERMIRKELKRASSDTQ